MWGNDYGYGYPMMGYGGYGFFHVLSSIFWVVVLVVLITMAVRALRGKPMWHGKHLGHHCDGDSALDILKERYAKGEIDREDFEQKKKDLSA